jgi:hypothetical protein
VTEHAGSRLNPDRVRKVPFDMPALKPYWGKPTVRNFREGDGDVGIMRSPIRAIALPEGRLFSLGKADPDSDPGPERLMLLSPVLAFVAALYL